jgi:hypothetical protein
MSRSRTSVPGVDAFAGLCDTSAPCTEGLRIRAREAYQPAGEGRRVAARRRSAEHLACAALAGSPVSAVLAKPRWGPHHQRPGGYPAGLLLCCCGAMRRPGKGVLAFQHNGECLLSRAYPRT